MSSKRRKASNDMSSSVRKSARTSLDLNSAPRRKAELLTPVRKKTTPRKATTPIPESALRGTQILPKPVRRPASPTEDELLMTGPTEGTRVLRRDGSTAKKRRPHLTLSTSKKRRVRWDTQDSIALSDQSPDFPEDTFAFTRAKQQPAASLVASPPLPEHSSRQGKIDANREPMSDDPFTSSHPLQPGEDDSFLDALSFQDTTMLGDQSSYFSAGDHATLSDSDDDIVDQSKILPVLQLEPPSSAPDPLLSSPIQIQETETVPQASAAPLVTAWPDTPGAGEGAADSDVDLGLQHTADLSRAEPPYIYTPAKEPTPTQDPFSPPLPDESVVDELPDDLQSELAHAPKEEPFHFNAQLLSPAALPAAKASAPPAIPYQLARLMMSSPKRPSMKPSDLLAQISSIRASARKAAALPLPSIRRAALPSSLSVSQVADSPSRGGGLVRNLVESPDASTEVDASKWDSSAELQKDEAKEQDTVYSEEEEQDDAPEKERNEDPDEEEEPEGSHFDISRYSRSFEDSLELASLPGSFIGEEILPTPPRLGKSQLEANQRPSQGHIDVQNADPESMLLDEEDVQRNEPNVEEDREDQPPNPNSIFSSPIKTPPPPGFFDEVGSKPSSPEQTQTSWQPTRQTPERQIEPTKPSSPHPRDSPRSDKQALPSSALHSSPPNNSLHSAPIYPSLAALQSPIQFQRRSAENPSQHDELQDESSPATSPTQFSRTAQFIDKARPQHSSPVRNQANDIANTPPTKFTGSFSSLAAISDEGSSDEDGTNHNNELSSVTRQILSDIASSPSAKLLSGPLPDAINSLLSATKPASPLREVHSSPRSTQPHDQQIEVQDPDAPTERGRRRSSLNMRVGTPAKQRNGKSLLSDEISGQEESPAQAAEADESANEETQPAVVHELPPHGFSFPPKETATLLAKPTGKLPEMNSFINYSPEPSGQQSPQPHDSDRTHQKSKSPPQLEIPIHPGTVAARTKAYEHGEYVPARSQAYTSVGISPMPRPEDVLFKRPLDRPSSVSVISPKHRQTESRSMAGEPRSRSRSAKGSVGSIVEIRSQDPTVAAHVAALLKVHHDFVPETSGAAEQDRLTLLLQEAEEEVATQLDERSVRGSASPRRRQRSKSRDVDRLAIPTRDAIQQHSEWKKADWRALEAVLKGAQRHAYENNLPFPEPPAVVDQFIEAMHLNESDLVGHWSRQKLLFRINALLQRRCAPESKAFLGSREGSWRHRSVSQGPSSRASSVAFSKYDAANRALKRLVPPQTSPNPTR